MEGAVQTMVTTVPLSMAVGGGFELNDLHSAAKQDDIMAIVKLLEEGANIDKRDPYG